MNLRRKTLSLLALLNCLWVFQVSAQWSSQTITLRPGWNAIYLEIQPEPRSCDTIFSNVPVESVWGWNRKFTPVEFIKDVSQLIGPQRDWLIYYPATNGLASQTSLYSLEGGKSYLVKMPSNTVSSTLVLVGIPTLRKPAWLANSFNFVGFPVSTNSPPTFQSFFQSSPAHAGAAVYRLNPSGNWLPASPGTAKMQSGEAFWIYTTGESSFTCPLSVILDQSTGLDYGSTLMEQSLRITNLTSVSQSVVVKLLPSLNPPNSTVPALAGPVALSYWNMNLASKQFWVPLPDPLPNGSVGANQTWTVRLEARRPDMPSYTGSVGPEGALYESILEVSDSAGTFHIRVPVTSQGLQTKGAQFASAKLGVHRALHHGSPMPLDQSSASSPLAGLWVGAATVNKVSQPSSQSDSTTPLAAAADFQLRLIFHVNDAGKSQMLQRVFQLWKPGTYTNNAANLAVVDQPGHFVLVSDDKYLSGFSGATISDGAAVGRRYSSAAFGYDNVFTNLIDSTFGSNVWSCQVTSGFNDPTNPFKHVFHPDHNNLAEDYQTPLGEGVESFTVSRTITLQFTPSDPQGLAVAGWGDNQIGGNYSEAIAGLHRSTIYVSGIFRLNRVSDIGVLNDGLTQ